VGKGNESSKLKAEDGGQKENYSYLLLVIWLKGMRYSITAYAPEGFRMIIGNIPNSIKVQPLWHEGTKE